MAAVSGGADSVALLDVLASLKEYRLNLVAAHLNHLLRDAEADEDEEYVRALAASYGVPVVVKREDVREIARREGRSLEDAGRCARYSFLHAVAAEHGARAVALAHHADDQAETVLMRLLRGAGGSGLCAMAPKTRDLYVRPFLGVSRREIEDYLRRRGIAWRNDSSNESPDFLRNRVRNELIPLLGTYNPAISERLAATAEALAADEEFLEAATGIAFTGHTVRSPAKVVLSVRAARSEPRGIRLRLYRRAILHLKGDLARISFRNLKAVDHLLFSSRPHQTLTLPDNIRAAKSYEDISFSLKDEAASVTRDELGIGGPGVYPLPEGGTLSVDFADPPDDPKSFPASVAFFEPEEAPFPWKVRTFRPGDRFFPFGMTGRKKVKELFIDAKVPLAARRRIPLLFCGEMLLWVGGLRRSNSALLTKRTKTAIKVELLDFPYLSSPFNYL